MHSVKTPVRLHICCLITVLAVSSVDSEGSKTHKEDIQADKDDSLGYAEWSEFSGHTLFEGTGFYVAICVFAKG